MPRRTPAAPAATMTLAELDDGENDDTDYDDDYDENTDNGATDDADNGSAANPMLNNSRQASLEKQLRTLAKSQRDLAFAVSSLAKAQQRQLSLAQPSSSRLRKHDEMDPAMQPDPGMGADMNGQSEEMGDEDMSVDHPDEAQGEDRLNLANGGYGKLGHGVSRAKLIKNAQQAYAALGAILNNDDTASSFGEIDSDEPGNHEFDPKNTNEDDTVITGKTGSGPGPMNGTLRKAIVSDLMGELRSAGLIQQQVNKSASTPRPGTNLAGTTGIDTRGLSEYTQTSINKMMESPAGMLEAMVPLSFQEINAARVEMVPGSLLNFPYFGTQGIGPANVGFNQG